MANQDPNDEALHKGCNKKLSDALALSEARRRRADLLALQFAFFIKYGEKITSVNDPPDWL